MSFTATDSAIRRFGNTIASLTDDADAAVSYVRSNLDIGYADGRMFFTVVETATEVREALVASYQRLAELADQSSREIDKAANYYRDTDRATAARMDATY